MPTPQVHLLLFSLMHLHELIARALIVETLPSRSFR